MNRRQFIANAAAVSFAGAASLGGSASVFAASSSTSKVKVGFIGTAHPHAAGKLEDLRALPDFFELVGVVEPNSALRDAAKGKAEYQGVEWIDEKELLQTPGLQAVVVETDFPELLPTAARAVDHNLFVHLDKPPGESLPQLEKLLNDAEKRKLYVQMGYMLRYNPAFELCFQAAREGYLGRIFELNTTMSTVRPAARRKELGQPKGGAMFDLGSHIIDALVTVLGAPQKVTAFGRQLYSKQDEVVDNQLAVFEYPDAIATVRTTFVEPFAGERRQFVVCGENGTLEIRPLEEPKLSISLQKAIGNYKAGRQDIAFPKMEGRYRAQLRDFADIIRGISKPRWSKQHDLAVQKALLEASGLA